MFKRFSVAATVLVAVTVGLFAAQPALAAPANVFQPCSGDAASSGTAICGNQDDQTLFGPGSAWNKILNTLIYVIGAASVLMIVIGGLRYTLSGGDSGAITSAKNTILYAVIGIIIAALAYPIVNFVLARI